MLRILLIAALLVPLSFGMAAAQDANTKLEDRVPQDDAAAGPRNPRLSAGDEKVVIRGSGAAEEWIGNPVVAADGEEVAVVTEVVTDTSGAVEEVHARVGGFLGMFTDTVVIPVARIILEEDGRLIAEMSADEIQSAPRVEEPGA